MAHGRSAILWEESPREKFYPLTTATGGKNPTLLGKLWAGRQQRGRTTPPPGYLTDRFGGSGGPGHG